MNRVFRVLVLVATLALLAGNAVMALATDDAIQATAPESSTPPVPIGHTRDIDPRLQGYPEFGIRISDTAIETSTTAAAGRTLIVQQNMTTAEAHVFVTRIPDFVTEAEIDAGLTLAATTVPMTTPDWLFQGLFSGNPDYAAPSGGEAAALVDLVPGKYLVMDPFRPDVPARFEVLATSATPVPLTAPPVDATVALYEMAFTLSDEIRPGRQVWAVTNIGAAFHEIEFVPVPAGATTTDAALALGATVTGASTEGQLDPVWDGWVYSAAGGVGVLSPGGTVWAQFDLAPGTYAIACFVPGPNGPHLMEGMIQIVTVAS